MGVPGGGEEGWGREKRNASAGTGLTVLNSWKQRMRAGWEGRVVAEGRPAGGGACAHQMGGRGGAAGQWGGHHVRCRMSLPATSGRLAALHAAAPPWLRITVRPLARTWRCTGHAMPSCASPHVLSQTAPSSYRTLSYSRGCAPNLPHYQTKVAPHTGLVLLLMAAPRLFNTPFYGYLAQALPNQLARPLELLPPALRERVNRNVVNLVGYDTLDRWA